MLHRVDGADRAAMDAFLSPRRAWIRPYEANGNGRAWLRTYEQLAVRRDPAVVSALSLWWSTASQGAELVARKDYIEMAMRIHKALYERWDPYDGRKAAEEGWEHAGLKVGCPRAFFEEELFNLADEFSLSTPGVSPHAAFLMDIFAHIVYRSPASPTGHAWRDLVDISFAGYHAGSFASTWGAVPASWRWLPSDGMRDPAQPTPRPTIFRRGPAPPAATATGTQRCGSGLGDIATGMQRARSPYGASPRRAPGLGETAWRRAVRAPSPRRHAA